MYEGCRLRGKTRPVEGRTNNLKKVFENKVTGRGAKGMLKAGARRENWAPVVPGCWQLTTQNNLAARTSGESDCIWAILQQSAISMPAIEQPSFVPCIGTATTALPQSTRVRMKDENRFTIATLK